MPISDPSPVEAYLARTADFLRAQEENDGSPEAEAREDSITDDLDILWYAMTPSQIKLVEARLAARSAIFVPGAPKSFIQKD